MKEVYSIRLFLQPFEYATFGIFKDKKRTVGFNHSAGCPEARGSAVGRGTVLQAAMSRVRFARVSLEHFINKILPAALWPRG
jgi:hypothetical protein